MKKVFWGAGIILLSLMGSGGESIASAHIPWQKVDEGFEYKSVRLEGLPYQTPMKMVILRIGLENFQVRIMDSRILGADRMEIKALTRKAQALAGINGGFFMPGYRPLGLLIVDGKETNPLRRADWGVFLIQDERARIIHTTEYQNEGNITQALQVGPRLVVNGRELQMKRQTARRSALGVTLKNQVILLTTEDTDIYAQDLAHFFHLPESMGGLECRDAMALDGGPSAQMFADYKDLKVHIPGGWGVPNGVGVFKRK